MNTNDVKIELDLIRELWEQLNTKVHELLEESGMDLVTTKLDAPHYDKLNNFYAATCSMCDILENFNTELETAESIDKELGSI